MFAHDLPGLECEAQDTAVLIDVERFGIGIWIIKNNIFVYFKCFHQTTPLKMERQHPVDMAAWKAALRFHSWC